MTKVSGTIADAPYRIPPAGAAAYASRPSAVPRAHRPPAPRRSPAWLTSRVEEPRRKPPVEVAVRRALALAAPPTAMPPDGEGEGARPPPPKPWRRRFGP